MKLTPVDVANRTFARKVMGLDAHEVYHFLRDAADQMEEIRCERDQLQKDLKASQKTLADFEDRDQSLRSTIQAASKMSDQFRSDAEREAHLILEDAKHRCEIMLKDARDNLKQTYKEIADLKRMRMTFETNLKSLLNSHLTMIEQGRDVFADPLSGKKSSQLESVKNDDFEEDFTFESGESIPIGPEGEA